MFPALKQSKTLINRPYRLRKVIKGRRIYSHPIITKTKPELEVCLSNLLVSIHIQQGNGILTESHGNAPISEVKCSAVYVIGLGA